MAITIEFSDSLKTDIKKNAILHTTSNSVRKWRFEAKDKNWEFIYTGSFRQACFVARRQYTQTFKTAFGSMILTDLIKIKKIKRT